MYKINRLEQTAIDENGRQVVKWYDISAKEMDAKTTEVLIRKLTRLSEEIAENPAYLGHETGINVSREYRTCRLPQSGRRQRFKVVGIKADRVGAEAMYILIWLLTSLKEELEAGLEWRADVPAAIGCVCPTKSQTPKQAKSAGLQTHKDSVNHQQQQTDNKQDQ